MKHPIPVILDGDPGHDDAIAWLIARASQDIDVRAVTSVCGNQTIEKTTYNAQRVCKLIELDAPIGMGAHRPLLADRMNAPSVHGESGLDGPPLPEPTAPLSPLPAVDLMAKVLSECETPLTIVSTGPLTNTASLLLSHPDLKPKIQQISLMGGGIAFGNWTPAAEFNILVDPEAAQVVFTSGIPLLMAGLDVTEKALIFPEDFARIRRIGNRVSDIVWQWLEFFYRFHRSIGYDGAPMHDPCAVVALLHPEFFEMHDYYVQIETGGEYCKGATVADVYGVTGHAPNARCMVNVDREKFVDFMVQAIESYSEGV